MNSHRVIERVVNATTSDDLCGALVDCQDVLVHRFFNREGFMVQLQMAMREQAEYYKANAPTVGLPGRRLANTTVYEDRESYLVYSSFVLNSCKSPDELDLQLSNVVELLGFKLTGPKTSMLSVDEISSLLLLVERKYNLVEAVTQQRELDVYALRRSHICYDSLLLTFKDTRTGAYLNKWMVFALSPCMDIPACNRYFVFLHEIGHILYNTVTGGGGEVLESFRELAEILGLPFFGDSNRLGELFADIFSAATLYNTPYSMCNPFQALIPHKVFDLLEMYFKMLAYRVDTKSYSPNEAKSVLH